MLLDSLRLINFRNFDDFEVEFTSGLNVVSGLNGAGKTSLLEAVFYLSRGKSFRVHLVNKIINQQADEMFINAQLSNLDLVMPVGVKKTRSGSRLIKVNGESQKSFADLTAKLPVLFLDTDTHRQVASSSKYRRSLLDWGCFYYFPEFLSVWQDYNRILMQRNSALKAGFGVSDWDDLLISSCTKLTKYRQEYFVDFIDAFSGFWQKFANDLPAINLSFYPGWEHGLDFAKVLQHSLNLDLRLGFTKVGAHRADILFDLNNESAFFTLSQGQQKIMAYALRLAQGELLMSKAGIACVYLIDDLPAELDWVRLQRLLVELDNLNAQVIITAINGEPLVKGLLTSSNVIGL